MSSPTDKDEVDSGQGAGTFPATEWNLVLSASREGSAEGGTALEALCRQYWYPVYAHVRPVGY
ncbi:MAG TPA: hypothetical protein PKM43_23895, partial [Verrucomicrobiota bacterium]|nr:hypothetical protein [Verrucomicrobiota bacterium]